MKMSRSDRIENWEIDFAFVLLALSVLTYIINSCMSWFSEKKYNWLLNCDRMIQECKIEFALIVLVLCFIALWNVSLYGHFIGWRS